MLTGKALVAGAVAHKALLATVTGVALLIPAAFVVGKHNTGNPVVHFEKHSDVKVACREAVEDYHREHPVPVCTHETILGKIEDVIRNVVTDVVKDIRVDTKALAREIIADLKEVKTDVRDDVKGPTYEWKFINGVWYYSYMHNGIRWYTYFSLDGVNVYPYGTVLSNVEVCR